MKPIRIGALVGSGILLSLGVISMPGCSSPITVTEGGVDSGGGTEGGGDAATGQCPKSVSCKNYCDMLTANCTGANLQLDNATCTSLCDSYTKMGTANQGMVADAMGATLGCRIYHGCVAGMSSANGAMHCPHANIWTGGDTCGTQCDAFCQIETSVCTGANAQFGGMNECLSKCGMWTAGKPTDAAGDTLGCRQYHLGVASLTAANATMHCPHTGNGPAEGGGNPVCK